MRKQSALSTDDSPGPRIQSDIGTPEHPLMPMALPLTMPIQQLRPRRLIRFVRLPVYSPMRVDRR